MKLNKKGRKHVLEVGSGENTRKRRFSGVSEEGGQVWAAEGCKAR